MKSAEGKAEMDTRRRKKMPERMKQALYKDAVLACDVPKHQFKRGDIVS